MWHRTLPLVFFTNEICHSRILQSLSKHLKYGVWIVNMNMRGFLYAKEIMKKCTKVKGSIQEGEQKAHKYTCFARSALCTGNLYYLYAIECLSQDNFSSFKSATRSQTFPVKRDAMFEIVEIPTWQFIQGNNVCSGISKISRLSLLGHLWKWL